MIKGILAELSMAEFKTRVRVTRLGEAEGAERIDRIKTGQ